MYAVIETGGKQYKVSEGDVILIERIDAAAGEPCVFDKVLTVSDGEKASFGTPYLKGAVVRASVLGDGKKKKVVVYKFKAKKGFHKKKGHRQPFTKVRIDSVAV